MNSRTGKTNLRVLAGIKIVIILRVKGKSKDCLGGYRREFSAMTVMFQIMLEIGCIGECTGQNLSNKTLNIGVFISFKFYLSRKKTLMDIVF